MGVAYMLGSPGTVSELSDMGPCYPLREPEQIILFARRHNQSTHWGPILSPFFKSGATLVVVWCSPLVPAADKTFRAKTLPPPHETPC